MGLGPLPLCTPFNQVSRSIILASGYSSESLSTRCSVLYPSVTERNEYVPILYVGSCLISRYLGTSSWDCRVTMESNAYSCKRITHRIILRDLMTHEGVVTPELESIGGLFHSLYHSFFIPSDLSFYTMVGF